MRGIVGFIILLVLAVFLLSNRDPASLEFWPFGFVVALPLGAVVLVLFVLGFLFGLLFQLPARLAATRRAKRAERRVAELEAQAARTPPPTTFAATPALPPIV